MPVNLGYNYAMRQPARALVPALLVALAVSILILTLVPLPLDPVERRWPMLARELQNFGHPVAFGLLAYCTLAAIRARDASPTLAPYVWTLAGIFILGILTEAAQARVGRQASWADLGNDMLGAAVASLLHAGPRIRGSILRRATLLAAATLAVIAIAPLATVAGAYACRALQGSGVLWREGTPLVGRFAHYQQGLYPGLVIEEPIADWRDWAWLEIDVESLEAEPLHISVRAHDFMHQGEYHDRYNEAFVLPGRSRELLGIPVEWIANAPATRTMDLSAMRGIVVFTGASSSARRFIVHQVRLVGKHDQVLVPSRPYRSSKRTMSSSPR